LICTFSQSSLVGACEVLSRSLSPSCGPEFRAANHQEANIPRHAISGLFVPIPNDLGASNTGGEGNRERQFCSLHCGIFRVPGEKQDGTKWPDFSGDAG
jgi:hypothetical protein